MSVVTFPLQHQPQSQRPAAIQEEVASSQNGVVSSPLRSNQFSILGPQSSVLVGRDAELAHLSRLFDLAMDGERQIVFVTGEAGIGKTTLVDAFLASLHNRPDVYLTTGQCVELYGPGEAYLPLLEATMQLCRGPIREQSIETLKRYAPSWLVQLPGLLDPEDRALLQQRVQGTSRERMLREMAEAAEVFTQQHVLVAVLEDLHWSDVSTQEWLSYIARRREPAKLLIIGTYRPADVLTNSHPLRGVVQELTARNRCSEIHVPPLSEQYVSDYLRARFHRSVADSPLPGLIHQRTAGNPLFVVNVVEHLLQQGVVRENAGRWHVQGDQTKITESVPDSLRQVIVRQIERLPVAVQQLLEVASIVGVDFSAAAVAAGLQVPVEDVDQQCAALARQGQFVRAQGAEEWPDHTLSECYSFHHALYQAVLAERVTETQQVRIHRRVGERKALAYDTRVEEIAAELAVHFEKGRDLARAVHYLGKAGETALRRNAHQEAIAHFIRALEMLATFPDTPERTRRELALHVALGVPLVRTRGYAAPEVARTYGRARELCQQIGEPPELFQALMGLCSFYLVRAELPTARRLAEQCLRVAQQSHDRVCLMVAHFTLGVTLFSCGELTDAHAILLQGSALYDSQAHGSLLLPYGQNPGVACRAYAALTKWLLGYPDHALGVSDEALTLARQVSHAFSTGLALLTQSWLYQYRQEAPMSQASTEEQLKVSRQEGFVLWLAVGTILRGWAMSEQGNEEEGLAQIREGLLAFRATGAELARPYLLALLAQAYGKSGQPHEGLSVLDEALAAVATTGERYFEAELYRLKGELTLQEQCGVRSPESGVKTRRESSVRRLASENPNPQAEAQAEACFLKALAIARRQQAKSLELRAAMSLARVWQRHGKTGEAREQLEEVYEWFTEGHASKDMVEAETLIVTLGGNVGRGRKRQNATGNTPTAQAPDLRPVLSATQSSVLSPQSVSSPILNPAPLAPNAFHNEGEYWTVTFAGTTCRLKETRGLHFIAQLLQHPHHEVHVMTLLTGGAGLGEDISGANLYGDASVRVELGKGFGDAGEMLDAQAKAAYKQRLSELREELAEAQQSHDLGRSEQLAAEIDFLTHELASAVGLGGRGRRMGSPAERARVNITRTIKLALRKIGERHPALGQHLATTIKTGTYCSYTPDIRKPISWRT